MFLTLTHDQVLFYYGSEQWQYNFNEILELGLLKKKKSYHLENIAFLLVTLFAYYFMIFSNFAELYFIIPTLLCYTILVILRFPKNKEFDYYVVVKDIYNKETKIKISAFDKIKIGKQIDQYLSLKFNHILQTT